MADRQTRVFVRSDEPFDDWAETLVGRVFRALAAEFADSLDWYWFSRYGCLVTQDSGDCDISRVPEDFKRPLNNDGEGFHRSMRFRFSIRDDRLAEFEQRAAALIRERGYFISDFRAYNSVQDTGCNRFLGTENRLPGRAEQRATLVTRLYMMIAALVIDALVGPDDRDRFRMETNDDQQQNPRGSTFQSILHLFCNITNVPTDVLIFQREGLDLLDFGTFMYPPEPPPGGWSTATPRPIRF